MVITLTYNMLNTIVSDKDDTVSSNKVLITTNMGNIIIELKDNITEDFKDLIQSGIYDGTLFHRVIADFMIQGGSVDGTGYGNTLIPEISDRVTVNNSNKRGTISLSGHIQFFINVVDNNHLDSNHPVLGEVIQGMNVIDSISNVETDADGRPIQNITIIKAILIT